MLFLGLDIGSSSIKASLLDGNSGRCVGIVSYPDDEMIITSPRAGWAEQDPDLWWHCVKGACHRLFRQARIDPSAVAAVGIAYQMHGLVLVDKALQPLRPAIIWCDSRAIDAGRDGLQRLGDDYCHQHLLNTPGNFTAAKLRWVQQHEPDVFARIHKAMLPGDYIAMRLGAEINTTPSALSEAALWDFPARRLALPLLQAWDIDEALIPALTPTIGEQGRISAAGADALGLRPGTPICYRAGDQPNNAFSLNALEPGDVASTAGTSGVIYGITDQAVTDRAGRVNTFLHVNDSPTAPRHGVLLCINGTGRLYSWLRGLLACGGAKPDYAQLNALAAQVPVGSEGLLLHPYGNGAERILQNRNIGAHMSAIDLNRHGPGHLARAAQEGIVFALNQGFELLKTLGCSSDVIRVGRGNMFLSDVFAATFASTTGTTVQIYDTSGAEGAARGAALGHGFYANSSEALASLDIVDTIEPDLHRRGLYLDTYQAWLRQLDRIQAACP